MSVTMISSVVVISTDSGLTVGVCTLVGAGVLGAGLTAGDRVGDRLGVCAGPAVGSLDGPASDGVSVGTPVGPETEGERVGLPEGTTVGPLDVDTNKVGDGVVGLGV